MNLISKCVMYVGFDDPQFHLHSNRCDYFSLGDENGSDVWLEGQIVIGESGPEFIFNGRLFCKNGGQATVIDSFPRADPPTGWTKQPYLDGSGYTLIDANGEIVFGFRVDANVCPVEVGLHKADGSFAAGPGQGGLVVNIAPAMIGRDGIVFA